MKLIRLQATSILILTTGGTIDGLDYVDETSQPSHSVSGIPRLLSNGRISQNVVVQSLFAKDSRFVSSSDLATMLQAVRGSRTARIIITHGTETMERTARFLGPHVSEKTVVLVGAMLPHSEPDSDAAFNLGYAVAAVQLLPSGVYVAMNGRALPWSNVHKNRTIGQFVPNVPCEDNLDVTHQDRMQ